MTRAALGSLVLGVCAIGAWATPSAARAQLTGMRRGPDPGAPKLMVVPFQRDPVDSALAVLLADGTRERMATSIPYRFNVIAKGPMNENLAGSGFPTDVPLEGNVVRQLARFLNARVVVEGSIIRRAGGDSMLVIARLAEVVGTNPQSATASTTVARARAAAGTGGDLGTRLLEAYKSFEHVENCNRFTDSSSYERARQALDRALREYPGSATAYLCKARILRAQNASPDSVLAALLRAHDSDSLNSLVLRQLATIYQERGDTTEMLHELRHVLQVDWRDNDLRIRVARLYVQRGMPDSSLVLVEEGLEQNPSSIELLQTKGIALAALAQNRKEAAAAAPAGPQKDSVAAEARRRWLEAATTLSQVAEVDSAHIDSLFALRITNYYREVGDTTQLLRWLRVVTTRMPTQALYFYTLADMLFNRADTAGAVTAIQQYMALLPNDARGHVAGARYLLAAGQLDSALVHAEIAGAADSAMRPFAGPIFLQAGARALQPPSNFTLADSLLGRAKDWSQGRAQLTAAFYQGVAQLQLAVAADHDAEANRSCDAARLSMDFAGRSEQNLSMGGRINPDQANTYLSQYIPALKQRADAMTRNYCR